MTEANPASLAQPRAPIASRSSGKLSQGLPSQGLPSQGLVERTMACLACSPLTTTLDARRILPIMPLTARSPA